MAMNERIKVKIKRKVVYSSPLNANGEWSIIAHEMCVNQSKEWKHSMTREYIPHNESILENTGILAINLAIWNRTIVHHRLPGRQGENTYNSRRTCPK